MTWEARLAAAFALDDEGWTRHANPWSGWTRFATTLPLLIAALWSRVWLGWWAAAPVGLALVWIWVNPRVFPPPATTRGWMSRGVLGERVWLNRRAAPVPEHHRQAPHLLSGAAAVGLVLMAAGVWRLDPWLTLVGFVLGAGAKLWFIDRMVWLYADMAVAAPECRRWLY